MIGATLPLSSGSTGGNGGVPLARGGGGTRALPGLTWVITKVREAVRRDSERPIGLRLLGSNEPPGPWCRSWLSRAKASSKGNATPLMATTGQSSRIPVAWIGNWATPAFVICLADVMVAATEALGTVTAQTSQIEA